MEFTSKRLDKLCDIIIGRTPSRSNKAYWGKGGTWVSISDLKSKYIKKTKEEITKLGIEKSRSKLIPEGTLLLSFKLSIGKLAFAGKDLYTNEAIVALPILDPTEIDKNYLYYILGHIPLIGGNQAAMGKTLNKKSLSALEIPYPKSLTDQKRIAKVLSDCEQLIAWRKESIQLLDDYLESVFLVMFGDPRIDSKIHKYGTIKDLIGDVVTGNTPPRKDPNNYGDFIEWIKTDNLNEKSKSISKATEYLSKSGLAKARVVDSGSLLVTCIAGSLKSIGTCGMTDRRISFNQQINAIVPFEDVDPEFLYCMFKLSKSYIQNHAKKGMKKILTKGEFEKIKFIKPEHDLQLKFSEIAKKFEVLKSQLSESLNYLKNLYSTLSQQAFKGELDLSKVVVDEEVEPAQSPEETTKVSAEKEGQPSFKKAATKPKGKRDIRNLTLLDHLGVPEEWYMDKIADDSGPELDFIGDDLFYQFYLKDNFADQAFTFYELQQKFNSYYISKGQDFEPRRWKSILYKFMEGKKPLVKQIFDEASGTIKLKLTDEAFKA